MLIEIAMLTDLIKEIHYIRIFNFFATVVVTSNLLNIHIIVTSIKEQK